MGNGFSNIAAFQSLHIVMLGLDSAGKTTVLYRLKFNEFVNTVPTIGFNTEKIKLSNGTAKGISCHFWDVGGQEKLRPLWKSYSRCTDGIIYVVDSVDVDRLEEAKTELHKVTKFAENQGTPLLVIANKQDLPKSLTVTEIEKHLALHELSPSTTYHVQPACAIIGEGLHEGMDKLYEMIVKRRKSLKQKRNDRQLQICWDFKGIVHPKMTTLSSFTHLILFQTCMTYLLLFLSIQWKLMGSKTNIWTPLTFTVWTKKTKTKQTVFKHSSFLCLVEKRMLYRFGMTWGWVNYDRIVILGKLNVAIKDMMGFALVCGIW